MSRNKLIVALSLLAMLVACGGGGGGGNANTTSNPVQTSEDRFTADVQRTASAASDDTEPVAIESIDVTESDRAEPVSTG